MTYQILVSRFLSECHRTHDFIRKLNIFPGYIFLSKTVTIKTPVNDKIYQLVNTNILINMIQ